MKNVLAKSLAIAIICLISTGPYAAEVNVERLRQTMAHISASDLQTSWELFQRGYDEIRKKHSSNAISSFETGLKLNPGEVGMRKLLARILEEEGRNPDALEHWRTILALASSDQDRQAATIAIERLNSQSESTGASSSSDQDERKSNPWVLDFSKCERPKYPLAELRNESTGTVTVELVINLNGVVDQVRVKKSTGYPGLDEAAKVAFASCRFDPAPPGRTARLTASAQYVFSLE